MSEKDLRTFVLIYKSGQPLKDLADAIGVDLDDDPKGVDEYLKSRLTRDLFLEIRSERGLVIKAGWIPPKDRFSLEKLKIRMSNPPKLKKKSKWDPKDQYVIDLRLRYEKGELSKQIAARVKPKLSRGGRVREILVLAYSHEDFEKIREERKKAKALLRAAKD